MTDKIFYVRFPTKPILQTSLEALGIELNHALDRGGNARRIASLRKAMSEEDDLHRYLYGSVNWSGTVKHGKLSARRKAAPNLMRGAKS